MESRLNRNSINLLRLLLMAAPIALSAGQMTAQVTFSKDVAPILYSHCVVCHRPNDIAPMSLVTYREVRPGRLRYGKRLFSA